MRGALQSRVKKIIILLTISTLFCRRESVISDNKVELTIEDKKMKGISVEEKNICQISGMLGCGSRTSESILKILNEKIGGKVVEIINGDKKIGYQLKVKDEKDNIYVVVIGRGYIIRKIYTDDEREDIIYKTIV